MTRLHSTWYLDKELQFDRGLMSKISYLDMPLDGAGQLTSSACGAKTPNTCLITATHVTVTRPRKILVTSGYVCLSRGLESTFDIAQLHVQVM